MKKYFINPEKRQYKANLHCHSNLSDGKLTPELLKQEYKKRGYSILAITDHERPKNHSCLTSDDFLMITGYEAYIRPSKLCVYDVYSPEIHLNLFAKQPENEAYICFNEAYCKYVLNPIERAKINKVGSKKTREYTVEYINEFIKTATDNGYLVAYNHPVWSMEDEERILSYENIFSLEIDNYSSWQLNRLEHSGALYDKLLRSGKGWFCHGSDDNHNHNDINDSVKSDSFGAFTMIMADSLDYSSVISSMEKGEMYSSTGPLIHEISLTNDKVTVKSSNAKVIICHDGSKAPKRIEAQNGSVNEAEFTLNSRAEYFRISVIDENGKIASSRGFFKNEW